LAGRRRFADNRFFAAPAGTFTFEFKMEFFDPGSKVARESNDWFD
jgi:hypothetical protein